MTRTFDASGLAISGSLAFGDDSLVASYTTGKGIGRYFNDSVSATGFGLDADDRLKLIRSSGATLYYQHFWHPDWMSVAGASTLWASDTGTRPPDALRRLVYTSANVVHRLLPNAAGRRRGAVGTRDARRRRQRGQRALAAFGALPGRIAPRSPERPQNRMP